MALAAIIYNDTTPSLTCTDDGFGPAIQTCGAGLARGGFDFTLLFEQSILSIIPSAVLLLALPLRGWQLAHQPRKVHRDWAYGCKLGFSTVFITLQLASLILWSSSSSSVTRRKVSVAAATLNLLDALALLALSHGEHTRSIRPSSLISTYLLFSLIFDVVQCRTLWLLPGSRYLAAIASASIGTKVCLLLLEASEKHRVLMPRWIGAPPEALSGIISRGLFWWVNELMRNGWNGLLMVETLYTVDSELESKALLERFQRIWKDSKPERKFELERALLKMFKWELLAGVFPRLCYVGFEFAQPFLINTVTKYISQGVDSETANVGYGLIAATGLIYIGLAVSNGLFNHTIYRVVTAARGALVSMIYSRTLELSVGKAAAQGPGALTLITVDVGQVCNAMPTFHDLWASSIEAGIALWLLERQLGIACIVPGVFSLVCFLMASYLSKFMAPRQRKWSAAVQERVKVTASILGNMKEIQLLGLVCRWTNDIQALREKELDVFKSFRMMTVYANLISQIMEFIAPVATFGIFVLTANFNHGSSFTVATVFTSLSLINLLVAPLTNLFHAIPRFAAIHGSFDRIQDYLSPEQRATWTPAVSNDHESDVAHRQTRDSAEYIEMSNMAPGKVSTGENIITMTDAAFSYTTDDPPVLRGIDLQIKRSTLNLIIGKVGSGKSTLLKAMLGELPMVSGSSNRYFNTAGYCDYQSWLVNDTVQNNIIGESRFDSRWYEATVQACALEPDFAQFPQRDQTLVGSKGITLSGGQKQRVALARAVYSQNEVLIVDDVLSGLDHVTEEMVWVRVFGPQGLLRQHGRTVILATHAAHYIRNADNITVLGDKKILQQGTYDQLITQIGYVQDLLLAGQRERRELETSDDGTDGIKANPRAVVSAAEAASLAQARDLSRQTGDVSLYSYYLKSVRWTDCIVYLILAAAFTFAHYFPQIWLKWWAQSETTDPGTKTGMFFGVYTMFGVVGLALLGICFWHFLIWIVPQSCNKLHLILLKTVLNAPLSFFVSTDTGVTLNRFSQDMTLLDMTLPASAFLTLGLIMTCLASGLLIVTGSKYLAIAIPPLLFILYCIQTFYLRTSRQMRHLDLEAKSPLNTQFLETLAGLLTLRAFGWQSPAKDTNARLLDLSQRPFYLLFCIQRWLGLVLDMLVAAIAVMLVAFTVLLRGQTSAGAVGVSLLNILNFSQYLTQLVTQWTALETSLGAIARLRDFEKDTPQETDIATSSPDGSDTDHDASLDSWPQCGLIEFKNLTASYHSSSPSNDEQAEPVLKNITLTIPPGQKVAICGRTGSGKSSLLLALARMLRHEEPPPFSSSSSSTGEILIDSRSISTVPISVLRSRLVFIPQEPVLFPGSLRFNAAPWAFSSLDEGERKDDRRSDGMRKPSDDEIISVLREVGLWLEPMVSMFAGGACASASALAPNPSPIPGSTTTNHPLSSSSSSAEVEPSTFLSTPLSSFPLSTGQKQLFCLARTVLLKRSFPFTSSSSGSGAMSPKRILLLDEPTANVDQVTEKVMMRVLGREFAASEGEGGRDGWTVMGITHRLGRGGEEGGEASEEERLFERVVMLDGGRVVDDRML